MATTKEALAEPGSAGAAPTKKGRFSLLTKRDKTVLLLMGGIPALIHLALVWVPALVSVILSFSRWDGIQDIRWIGFSNYSDAVTIYPPFWDAVLHNFIWLLCFVFIATPFGMLLAVLLDKELKGHRFYQSVFFLPVVISLALVGFIWQLMYAPDFGFINETIGRNTPGNYIDWLGNSDINLYAVLVAASWRHAGYIMILYLAGLKGVDPQLKEAAAIDGANGRQTFFHVTFPALRPVNIVIAVITIIETLRAFDIVYIINQGRNGLELLATSIVDNLIGEAARLGFGSALGTILLTISLIVIIPYLVRTFRQDVQEL